MTNGPSVSETPLRLRICCCASNPRAKDIVRALRKKTVSYFADRLSLSLLCRAWNMSVLNRTRQMRLAQRSSKLYVAALASRELVSVV